MSDKRSIKFRYIFPEDYNPIYCNGVYGGISPSGDIIANFFLERMPIPNSMTNDVNEDGTLSGVVSVDPADLDNILIRNISSGIILNKNSAKSIYEWLGRQIEEIENREKVNDVSEEE